MCGKRFYVVAKKKKKNYLYFSVMECKYGCCTKYSLFGLVAFLLTTNSAVNITLPLIISQERFFYTVTTRILFNVALTSLDY